MARNKRQRITRPSGRPALLDATHPPHYRERFLAPLHGSLAEREHAMCVETPGHWMGYRIDDPERKSRFWSKSFWRVLS